MIKKLWIQRINAGARLLGMSYSKFINCLRIKGVEINKKMLADKAMNNFDEFKAICN